MKTLVLLATLFSLSLAIEIIDVDSLNIKNLKFDLDKNFVEEFQQRYEQGDDAALVALVNEYADKIFKNIEVFSVNNNLDPISIADVEEDFLGTKIELTNGQMFGVSTIERADDVTVSYASDNQNLEIYVPFRFSDLTFKYHHQVTIVLIKIHGGITGTIEELEMKIRLRFDFNTYHAEAVEVDTENEGKVSLKFDGDSIIDKVVNVLTQFVVEIIHPAINSKIHDIVNDVVANVVQAVNDAIDGALHPTVASLL